MSYDFTHMWNNKKQQMNKNKTNTVTENGLLVTKWEGVRGGA